MPTSGGWRALPYPDTDGHTPADIPVDIKALADALALVGMFDKGLARAIPAFGRAGFMYFETDTGLFKLDIGAAWLTINPTLVQDGDPAQATLRSLGNGALQACSGNDTRLSNARLPIDLSVIAGSLADSLVPSRGASAATEAVRRLGVGANDAAAGNDGRFPSAAEKLALGGTSGAPSPTNKFVTDADLRLPGLGFIMEYGGAGDPNASWMLIDGRELARAGTYAPLFRAIGTTHGAGDGSTTFNIPDGRGRFSLVPDNMGTARGAANRITSSLKALGQSGGVEFHTHAANIPNHTHVGNGIDHLHAAGSLVVPDHAHGISAANVGSGNGYAAGGGESVAFTRHIHTVNGAGPIGVTGATAGVDRSLTFTTGGPSVTAFTTAQANALPPYVVLNKIIRVL